MPEVMETETHAEPRSPEKKDVGEQTLRAITRIAATFKAWREVEKYSRIVTREEVAMNHFNISPTGPSSGCWAASVGWRAG